VVLSVEPFSKIEMCVLLGPRKFDKSSKVRAMVGSTFSLFHTLSANRYGPCDRSGA